MKQSHIPALPQQLSQVSLVIASNEMGCTLGLEPKCVLRKLLRDSRKLIENSRPGLTLALSTRVMQSALAESCPTVLLGRAAERVVVKGDASRHFNQSEPVKFRIVMGGQVVAGHGLICGQRRSREGTLIWLIDLGQPVSSLYPYSVIEALGHQIESLV